VFGRRLAPSTSFAIGLSPQVADLQSRITALRTRLQSLGVTRLVRSPPGHNGNIHTPLPSLKEALDKRSSFTAVAKDAAALPATVEEDSTVNSELKAFRSELVVARAVVQRLVCLGEVCDKVIACDHALSDLLEHADTYPAARSVNQLASPHKSDARLPCEEQLASRMAFTRMTIGQLNEACVAVANDSRVVAEQTRLQQAWSELADMCTDRINGTRSRPESSVSSGRSSGAASGSLSKGGRNLPSAGLFLVRGAARASLDIGCPVPTIQLPACLLTCQIGLFLVRRDHLHFSAQHSPRVSGLLVWRQPSLLSYPPSSGHYHLSGRAWFPSVQDHPPSQNGQANPSYPPLLDRPGLELHDSLLALCREPSRLMIHQLNGRLTSPIPDRNSTSPSAM
jgi:hypothetical protein